MHDGIVYKFLVNGEWRTSTSGRTIQNLTPYDETVCYEVQACTQAEIDEAYEGAAKAQKEWAKTPLWKRAELLHKAAAVLRQYAAIIATRTCLPCCALCGGVSVSISHAVEYRA